MSFRPTAHDSGRPPPAVIAKLHRAGLSQLGAQQALQGSIVTNAADRAAIAGILSNVSAGPAPPGSAPRRGGRGNDRIRTSRPSENIRLSLETGTQSNSLSPLGFQQALQGDIVTDPNDRNAVANILAAVADPSVPKSPPPSRGPSNAAGMAIIRGGLVKIN